MKKARSKKPARSSIARRPAAKKQRRTAPMPGAAVDVASVAHTISETARKAYKHTAKLHKKADEVHQSAHAAHQRSAAVHTMASLPPPSETAIVLDDKSPSRAKPFLIVGVGASAGGYEAFCDFLTQIPKRSGMAIVLVQHLDPNHKSMLRELLSTHTHAPVVLAADKMSLKPDAIYVIPENTVMTMSDGYLKVVTRTESSSQAMPVDAFFRSLAEHQQTRAVGVVLSGTGSDGTLGLQAIKAEGGITFAQDEQTAKFFGMPGSAVASGAVDFVMPTSEIAKELGRIARHPWIVSPNDAGKATSPRAGEAEKLIGDNLEELGTLFALLRGRSNVDFSLYKQSTLKRRIARRMILHRIHSLRDYLSFLQKDRGELEALFNDLLINVTSFFRDPKTFQVLKKRIFAKILKNRQDDGPLRFWVCGCATGEEAYSLAMCLVEFFNQTSTHRPVQIFSTDISEHSIEKARAGIYPESFLQDVSPERIRRFFTKVDGGYQVNKPVRDMCVFARQNVLVDPPFSNLDLVSCRNVLIYFGPVLQRRLIPLFHYALRPRGFLLLGGSETIGGATDYFSLVDKRHKLYSRKVGMPHGRLEFHRPQPQTLSTDRQAAPAVPREQRAPVMQQQVDRLLLREFSPAAVVINTDMDVIQFRGRTGDYLEHAPGTATLNLLKMARESITLPLRSAVTKAIKENAPHRHSGIVLEHNKHLREITIEIQPFKIPDSRERFFLVVFRDGENVPPPGRHVKEPAGTRAGRERRELGRLREELDATKESLQSIIEEQETTNEELRSANEEIQSSNEELQSTNEELETAKEELQSTNEELTTLNEELQVRNTDLSQVNNDLTNLIGNINIALIMVDQDMTIRRFTPAAERFFSLIPSDVGRRLHELNRNLVLPDLESLVREVTENLAPVEREAKDLQGRSYSVRIRPYRTHENRIDGAVILLIDTEEIRRTTEAMMEVVTHPLLLLGPDMVIRNANDAFTTTFGTGRTDLIDRNLFEVAEHQWDIPELRNLLENTLLKSKYVRNFPLEVNFAKIGWRKMLINARRLLELGQGKETVFLSLIEAGQEK